MLAISNNLFSLKNFLNNLRIDINIFSKIRFIIFFYLFFYPKFLWTIKKLYHSIDKIDRDNYREYEEISIYLGDISDELEEFSEKIKIGFLNRSIRNLLKKNVNLEFKLDNRLADIQLENRVYEDC